MCINFLQHWKYLNLFYLLRRYCINISLNPSTLYSYFQMITCSFKNKIIIKLIKNTFWILFCFFHIVNLNNKSLLIVLKCYAGTNNELIKLNQSTKNSLTFFFAYRAIFICSRAAEFSFASCIPFKKQTSLRAVNLSFESHSWAAGSLSILPIMTDYSFLKII